MADMLDRDNQHLFLHKPDNAGNSFIANVNLLANNFPSISKLVDLFDEDKVQSLIVASKLNASTIADDLEKGSLNGFRKLDIDLLHNYYEYFDELSNDEKVVLWTDPSRQIYYDSATVTFIDKTSITKEFSQAGVSTPVCNHHQLYNQFNNWSEFKAKASYTMFNIVPSDETQGLEILRFWDGEDSGSSIQSIELHVAAKGQNQAYDSFFAKAKEYEPTYTWLDSTSVLTAIANSVNRILSVSDKLGDLLELVSYLPEINSICAVLDKLASTDTDKDTLFKNLELLKTIYNKLSVLEAVKDTDKVLKEANSRFNELKETKANKITTTVRKYEVDGYDIISNYTYDYHLGDKLKSGIYTFTVTATDDEGRITKGTITPAITNTNNTGYYEFVADNIFSIDIHNKAVETTQAATLDLIDVYSEYQARMDIVSKSIISMSHRLKQLEEIARHQDLYDSIAELEEALVAKLDVEVFVDYTEQVAAHFATLEAEVATKTSCEQFNEFLQANTDGHTSVSDKLGQVNTSVSFVGTRVGTSIDNLSDNLGPVSQELKNLAQTIADKDTGSGTLGDKLEALTQAIIDKDNGAAMLSRRIDTLTDVIAHKDCGASRSGTALGVFAFEVGTDGILYMEEAGVNTVKGKISDNGILELELGDA